MLQWACETWGSGFCSTGWSCEGGLAELSEQIEVGVDVLADGVEPGEGVLDAAAGEGVGVPA